MGKFSRHKKGTAEKGSQPSHTKEDIVPRRLCRSSRDEWLAISKLVRRPVGWHALTLSGLEIFLFQVRRFPIGWIPECAHFRQIQALQLYFARDAQQLE